VYLEGRAAENKHHPCLSSLTNVAFRETLLADITLLYYLIGRNLVRRAIGTTLTPRCVTGTMDASYMTFYRSRTLIYPKYQVALRYLNTQRAV
jgi:hypothetical protein